jgi:hypothetical protein
MAYESVVAYSQTLMEGLSTVQTAAMSLTTQLAVCEYDMNFTDAMPLVEQIHSWMPSVSSYARALADELDSTADPELWSLAQRLATLVATMESHAWTLVPVAGQVHVAATLGTFASDAQTTAITLMAGASTAMTDAAVREAEEAAQARADKAY